MIVQVKFLDGFAQEDPVQTQIHASQLAEMGTE